MNVLILGGTGLIGTGIVKHLLARGARVTTYARGRHPNSGSGAVTQISGDRTNVAEFERTFERSRYDVVIDMICFTPAEAECTVRAFGGRCEQLQFCSTVCTYGPKVPPDVLIDERWPQVPVSAYGRNKVACERVFLRAALEHRFELTILRPSQTYGPGGALVDQLELDGGSWDRIERGLPILCAGDGLGLWQPTHRDDCGRLFAYAAQNPKTYGQEYNATGEEVMTWRDYYRRAASMLGTSAKLLFVPASWLIGELPRRFEFLSGTTQFHGGYSSVKARHDVPEFRSTIAFEAGARETFADIRRRGAWRDSRVDSDYQRLVEKAIGFGFVPVEA
jgi:nucleoside-diphosphate-sugar epimerase